MRNCGDCGAKPGQLHIPGCDMEECPICGKQIITCPHCEEVTPEQSMPWEGERRLEQAARRYGWYCRWQSRSSRWETVTADAEDAMPDGNRVLYGVRVEPGNEAV